MENRTLNINKEPYLFRKELGSGAFGCVFSARRTTDGSSTSGLHSSLSQGTFLLFRKTRRNQSGLVGVSEQWASGDFSRVDPQ